MVSRTPYHSPLGRFDCQLVEVHRKVMAAGLDDRQHVLVQWDSGGHHNYEELAGPDDCTHNKDCLVA
jgi:hypothetical protein